MEHDRWNWFAGGVALGVLIGIGIAAGYCMTKVAAAEKARVQAEEALEVSEGRMRSMMVDVGGARGSIPLFRVPIDLEAP